MSKTVAKANRAAYLANVLSIAKVEGAVAAPESLVLRSIIHSIGGTREDVAAAGAMLGDGHYRLQLPESLEERRNNLQDMIMVAFADGRLSPTEAAPIEKMAKVMGYGQTDMDLVVQQAKSELRRIGKHPESISTESAPPPIPGAPPDRSARVMRQKAIPLPLHLPAHLPPPLAEEGIASEASPAAPEAERVAQASVPREPLEAEGEPSEKDPAALPAAVKACMRCRAGSEHPETYCFGIPDGPVNPWGCRLSMMPWESGVSWMGLGRFRDDATFLFDKQAIAEKLSGHLASVLACPHLDTAYTEAALEALPERALIGPRWRYRPAGSSDPGAVTVRTTHYVHGCAVSTTLTVDGVDPIGEREAMKMMRRAGRRLSARALLPLALRNES